MAITKNDMNFMKADQLIFLPDIGKIYRKSVTNGPLGAVESYTFVASAKCRIAPIGDRKSESLYQEQFKHNAQVIEFLHIATFPQDTDIQMIDRVLIDTKWFEVTAILTRQSYETAKRVMLMQVIA